MEFVTDIEVRYSETDCMGVVYHANYFSWFDVARCRLLEEIGFPYPQIEADGYQCPVIDAHISYGVPFKFGETATIYTHISQASAVRTTYSYRIFAKGEESRNGEAAHHGLYHARSGIDRNLQTVCGEEGHA